MTGHPSKEALRAFAAGDGDDSEFQYIEAHLQDCPQCVDALERLAGAATVRAQIEAMAGQESLKDPQPDGTWQTAPDSNCPASNSAQLVRRDSTGADAASAGATTCRSTANGIPRQLDRYQLERVLGEGGMGVVFRARQSHPVQRYVALKVLKPGVDHDSAIRRFELERQTLASLDHPRIAKLLDAGTAEGFHFFAMEMIEGQSLCDYSDDKGLSIERRLALFGEICETIQFAHHRGIIHRDLKPSNILVAAVDGQAQLKVIDFGIAKLVDQTAQSTMMTEFGQVLGTWQYMSPEQLSLDPSAIDTRSDVYSLGAILYELLTDVPPLDLSGHARSEVDAIYNTIRHQEPNRASRRLSEASDLPKLAKLRNESVKRLVGRVAGELDWIAAKALEKDPALRYQSAGELGEDIFRHLRGDRLSIPAPSKYLAVRKFARRHRGALTAGLLVMASLIVGAALFFWQFEKTLALNDTLARRTYIAEIRSAQDYFRQGNFDKALALVEAQIPPAGAADFRGWEWYHLRSRCKPQERIGSFTYGVHQIQDIEYSPDGSKLAIAQSSSLCAAVLDVVTQQIIAELNCNHRGVSVAFTPDGKRLAVACNNGELYVWDYAQNEVIYLCQPSTRMLRCVAISPDGLQLVAGGDEGLYWWDMQDLEKGYSQTPSKKFIIDCDFSPDGNLLITGDRTRETKDGQLVAELALYDAASRERMGTTIAVRPGNHATEVRSVEFYRGNEHVLAGLSNGLIAVWQLGDRDPDSGAYEFPTLKPVKSVATGGVFSVKQSADGAFFANGATNNRIQLWRCIDVNDFENDPEERWHLKDLRAHSATVRAVDFCPRTGTLATADTDALIRFWKPTFNKATLDTSPSSPVCMAVDTNGNFLALGDNAGNVSCWRMGDELVGLLQHSVGTSRVIDIEFLPSSDKDQLRLAVIDRSGTLSIIQSSKLQSTLSSAATDIDAGVAGRVELQHFDGPFQRCVLDPKGSCLWVGGCDGKVSRLDLNNGQMEAVYQPCNDPIYVMELFPKSRALLTVSERRQVTIRKYDGHVSTPLRPEFPVREVAISPDERYLAICGESRTILVYDRLNAKQFKLMGHSARVLNLKFSRDGTRLATSGQDQTVRLWETETWQEVFAGDAPGEWVVDLEFSMDDSQLTCSCSNGRVVTWRSPKLRTAGER
ncbi:serine/threonine-protein kinase [Aureliella helgolandensis]|uniref:Serine/threonine-protein kinase PknB n=1 Tax=Aureliella helgolandensis TaxID=2527968 RepID=A0A518G3J9_9BACT|nr:serine/threonine-protein kinase [Aureliella helgolandensis]QDV23172.1 Serine/threonine-protein kinase PknB [Aureliella helgolandensis]